MAALMVRSVKTTARNANKKQADDPPKYARSMGERTVMTPPIGL